MTFHLLVLAPYAASLPDPPASPPSLEDCAGYTIEWRPVPTAMSGEGGFADAAIEDLAVMSAGQHESGFDALIVHSVGDGGAAALRSVLDVLVMGAGKTAALYALTLGGRFSFLVHSRAAAMRVRSELRQWRLESHCASVRVIAADETALLDAAQQCVAQDGAEVICLGDSALAPLARGLAASIEVPVIDPLPLACEMAAALLAAGLRHSRAAAPRPRVPKPAVLDAMAQAMATRR